MGRAFFSGARVAALAALFAPLALFAIASCTDGTTPNCADPAVKCGPDLDGSDDGDAGGQRLPEAAPRADADTDAAGDAASDANLDASDAG